MIRFVGGEVHPLYSIMAFVGALFVLILLSRIAFEKPAKTRGRHFALFGWVLFFCLQDGIWGLFASHIIQSDIGLLIFSTVFHLSSAFSTYFWVSYHIGTLGSMAKHPRVFRMLALGLVGVQSILLVVNLFLPFMFKVNEQGEYAVSAYRYLLFFLQIIVYIAIGVGTVAILLRNKKKSHRGVIAAMSANLSPLAFSLVQMFYPDLPANSISLSLGCVIIYTFLASEYERQVSIYEERQLLQPIIEKQNEELKEQQKQLQEALHREEAANKAKTSFLFNMSHDIRTPMNAITGFTMMTKKYAHQPEKVIEYIEKIEIAGNQLLSLINQVLEMARIEAGATELKEEATNISEFTNTIRTIYEEVAAQKGLKLSVRTKNMKDRHVIADSARLKQIVTNIIGNSIKYTLSGGSVDITVEEFPCDREGYADYVFTCKDTGIGMSKEFQEHVYEEFSRENSSTVTGIQGTGLGMSIVKQLTDAMGGRIALESEKGKGTTFAITIPMKIDEDALNKQAIIEHQEQHDMISVEGLHVLLTDDNEMNREITTEILQDAGITVDTAEDGKSAVEMVRKMYEENAKRYDCILMDIQMPGMNGYDAARAIRALCPSDDALAIVAISANAFEEDRTKSLQAGMDAHIAKPINISEFMTVLAKLRRKE